MITTIIIFLIIAVIWLQLSINELNRYYKKKFEANNNALNEQKEVNAAITENLIQKTKMLEIISSYFRSGK